MRHGHHFLRHFEVVFIAGNGFAIGLQTAVHHDGAETQIDRALAHVRALTVVLVHHHRNFRVGLDSCLNQELQKAFTRIFASASRSLHDHRRTRFFGSLHDGLNLL